MIQQFSDELYFQITWIWPLVRGDTVDIILQELESTQFIEGPM